MAKQLEDGEIIASMQRSAERLSRYFSDQLVQMKGARMPDSMHSAVNDLANIGLGLRWLRKRFDAKQ